MGHIRIVYDGKSYVVDEDETIKTLKTKVLNLAPETMLVSETSIGTQRPLKDDQRISESGLKDGEVVMPLVIPEYG